MGGIAGTATMTDFMGLAKLCHYNYRGEISSMKIKDVLAKIREGEELTDAEKEFIGSYEEPDLDAVANARSKKERLKLEAKIDDLKAKNAEALEALDEAKEGANQSELEQLQKKIEKMEAKYTETTGALEKERNEHLGTRRSNKLKGMNIPFLDSVDGEYREYLLNKHFDGIDFDDLSDANVTTPIREKMIAEQAAFMSSGKTGGAGTGDGDVGKPLSSGNSKWTRAKIAAAQADGSYGDHAAEIKTAMASGQITE